MNIVVVIKMSMLVRRVIIDLAVIVMIRVRICCEIHVVYVLRITAEITRERRIIGYILRVVSIRSCCHRRSCVCGLIRIATGHVHDLKIQRCSQDVRVKILTFSARFFEGAVIFPLIPFAPAYHRLVVVMRNFN